MKTMEFLITDTGKPRIMEARVLKILDDDTALLYDKNYIIITICKDLASLNKYVIADVKTGLIIVHGDNKKDVLERYEKVQDTLKWVREGKHYKKSIERYNTILASAC